MIKIKTKVKYVGKMGSGIVEGIGGVKRGESYDVPEELAEKLLKTPSWEKVVKEIPVKKPKVKKEEKLEEGGKIKW